MRWTSTAAASSPFRLIVTLLLGLVLLARPGHAQSPTTDQGLVADSTELRALRAFYRSTQGEHWFNHANWPATDSAWTQATMAQVGTWAGVTTANGDVTALSFFNNGIGGVLPPEIGLLGGLQYLDIERNRLYGPQFPVLSGTLPKELGQLHQLKDLIIQFTELTGSIPAELGQLQQLNSLQLVNNHLSGRIPPELGQLHQLTVLVLDNWYAGTRAFSGHLNAFVGGIPPELGQLTNLTYLALDMNPLGGPLPPQLQHLTHLTFLELDDNQLSGAVPVGVLRLPALQTLILGGTSYGYQSPNTFSRLPSPNLVPNLAQLQLVLERNQFGFNMLEPYFTGPGQMASAAGSTYLPQTQPVLGGDTLRVVAQQPARFDVQRDSALVAPHSTYQWQRQVAGQWADIAGQTQPQLSWAAVTAAEVGTYRCRATNDWVTDLTLYSRTYSLQLRPDPALARNLPDDANTGPALLPLTPTPDAPASAPADVNFVRTWVPRVALQPAAPLPPAPASTGVILREQWDGVAGSDVSGIPTYLPPTSTGYLSSLEGPTDDNQFNYGDRTRGFLVAPQSGDYVFAIAGDDNSEFWLSPDSLPAHKVRRAYVPGYTPSHGWHWYPDQQVSAPLTLVAGQRYYLEVLHKQGYGGDNVAVGWLLPGTPAGAEPVVVPGSALAPLRTSPAADAPPSWAVDVAQRTTQYLDGLGRPVQTVRHGASPQYRDLVQAQAYDGLGREPRQYLPYAADTTHIAGNPLASVGYHYQALTEQQDFYHRSLTGPPSPQDPATGVARTGVAYAETQFEASPLNRVLQQGAAGEAWQLGGGHVLGRQERPNTAADSVLRFIPGYDPRSLDPGYQGFYAPGELWGIEVSDAQGPAQAGAQGYRTIEWKDKLGQLVLKQVEAARMGGAGSSRWLRTAYVYDDFQHLRFVLQPEGTKQLLRPGSLPTATLPFLFHYRYDGRGRQLAKQVPGQDGETLVVFDQLDRPVLSQDAQQRTRREWSWTKYDALGRIVLNGLVTRGDTLGQVSLQALATADTATSHQYEQRTADGATYPQFYTTDQSFPQLGQQGFGIGQVLSVTCYDDYNFDNDAQGVADATYDTGSDYAFPAGQAPVPDALRTTGLVTQTRTRVLHRPASDPGVDWLVTTTFYDERARPVQVQTLNARGGHDRLTTQLDFTGKVVQSVAEHQGIDFQPLTVQEFFTYDHDGRVLTSRQQLPGEAQPVRLSARTYNELGQLLVDSLASGQLSQRVDYVYNIRGWLTRLNDPFQPNGQDLFNLSLHYEAGFTRGYEQYNGNLTGQTWRGRDGVQRAYGYGYDPQNRLLQGDFVARAGGSAGTLTSATSWNQEQDNYRLASVSYDDNGNIQTLRRQGLLQNATHATSKQYGAVDNLTYAYQGNRLQAVDDAVSGNQLPRPANYNGAPTSLAGDFQEQGVKLGQEYLYDANGNLTQDKNKGITGILYNHLNLPRQIHFGAVGDSVVFRYSAAGQKVAKLVYQTGKPLSRTDYLGPYQYEQDSLKFFPHAAGRVLRFVQTDPAGQATVSYQREFTIKDHLGNLRLAYRAGQVRTLLATLEQDENTRKRERQQFDSLSVSPPVAVQTPYSHGAGSWAARLNAGGSTPQPIGPLTQLGVQQGDTLTVSAYGLYQQPVQHGFLFSLASFIANLLHPASPPPAGLDGRKRSDLPLLQVGVAAGLSSIPQLSGGVPKGYLRVLIFNKDSALVSQRTRQLRASSLNGYDSLQVRVIVPQDGYVTAYVGNESDVDVLFDDVQLEHRPGLQVQETQYDPAGLELAGLAAPSSGIKGLNNYRFNGKEFQADLGLAWNHQDWRFFDPQLLRWHAGDPEVENGQESWTPYSFGYDNAVRYADADGRCPECPDSGGGTKLLDSAAGFLSAVADDVFGSSLSQYNPRAGSSGFERGQTQGHVLMGGFGAYLTASGAAEAAAGGTVVATAALAEGGSLGTATPVAAPAAAAGGVMVVDGLAKAALGGLIMHNASRNLQNTRATDDNGRVNASSSESPRGTKHSDNRHIDRTKYPEKSKYLKPSQQEKLVQRTMNNPDKVTQQGSRTRYDKTYGRKIGTRGETSHRVVVDERLNKRVTDFPQHAQ